MALLFFLIVQNVLYVIIDDPLAELLVTLSMKPEVPGSSLGRVKLGITLIKTKNLETLVFRIIRYK